MTEAYRCTCRDYRLPSSSCHFECRVAGTKKRSLQQSRRKSARLAQTVNCEVSHLAQRIDLWNKGLMIRVNDLVLIAPLTQYRVIVHVSLSIDSHSQCCVPPTAAANTTLLPLLAHVQRKLGNLNLRKSTTIPEVLLSSWNVSSSFLRAIWRWFFPRLGDNGSAGRNGCLRRGIVSCRCRQTS